MTGKLELSFNSNKMADYPLDQEVTTIGRKPDNMVVIDNLAVSGYHAKILTIFQDSFLEDLDSTNGTYVNGTAIKKHALKNGDVILVGKHELKYVNEQTSVNSEFDKTVFIRPNIARNPVSPPAKQYIAATPDKQTTDYHIDLTLARLQVLTGKNAGKELALVKDITKIGKPGILVVAITKRPDGHFIIKMGNSDLNSKPVLVNGADIGQKTKRLQNHDIIDIASLKIEYYIGSGAIQ